MIVYQYFAEKKNIYVFMSYVSIPAANFTACVNDSRVRIFPVN